MNGIIHLVGSCLLVGAGAGLGWIQKQKLSHKRILLEDILELILFFQAGICSTKTSLPELWKQLQLQTNRFRILECSQQGIFSKEIMKQTICTQPFSQKLLDIQDKLLLEKWIDFLGSGTVEQEEQKIQYLQTMLNRSKQQAWEQEKQNGKMYLSLGVCAGLAVAVLTL